MAAPLSEALPPLSGAPLLRLQEAALRHIAVEAPPRQEAARLRIGAAAPPQEAALLHIVAAALLQEAVLHPTGAVLPPEVHLPAVIRVDTAPLQAAVHRPAAIPAAQGRQEAIPQEATPQAAALHPADIPAAHTPAAVAPVHLHEGKL